MAAIEPSAKPQRIGRYELLFEIATGGMGRVFLARQVGDAGFERLVALKRVHPHLVSDADVYAMASDEARLTAMIHHPNVVPVIDVIDAGGELVLVMDYVEGASLSALIKSAGALPPPIASRIALDALRGLSAAHHARDLTGMEVEMVHRDVSPQNLLVGIDGTTRLIDFGIARAEGRLALTKSGVVKGKVAYMAPERLDQGGVDARSDLYGVGAVLFELVAGTIAFGSGDESAQMARVLLGSVDLGPIEARAPTLVPVLARALARKPADRFPTAESFVAALSAAVPPADHDAVARAVREARGVDLDERRERIRQVITERAAQQIEDDADRVGAPDLARSADAVDARPGVNNATVATPRSARLAVFGGLILAVNVAGYVAISSARSGAGAAATPTASPATPPLAPSAPRSGSTLATAAPSATPDVGATAMVTTAMVTTAMVTTAAPLDAGRPADLRKSPYKAP